MLSDFRILIVDDEPNIRSGLKRGLKQAADEIETAIDATEALQKFAEQPFQLVIVDVRLPGAMSGLELTSQLLQQTPETTIIVITAHGTVETAVDAMRRGAFDFIAKPVDLNLIRQQINKAVAHHRLRDENRQLRYRLADVGEISGVIGNSAVMRELYRQIRQVADTDATVMIHGESGTGKELVARALHELSRCQERPLVAMNLGALPESLLESELFGHEKGAFSGATRQKPGCFEQAVGGTLFLDEVSEMSSKSQLDLLRVLETGNYTRVGGEQILESDVRIVSATNRNIKDLIKEGSFREDLCYRLNVIPIELPPLRQRTADIPLLVEHFLKTFCERHRRQPKTITPEAIDRLLHFSWPGNVRQLRNVIERLVVTTDRQEISRRDLPADIDSPPPTPKVKPTTLAAAVEKAEREAIQTALAACDFHREQTAQRLGISLRTLHYKMSRHDLH
jgi:two-component system NtrC family response regulator